MTEEFYTNIELINKRMPDDISQEIKDFTLEKINEFLHHIYESMHADIELEIANKENFISQTIAQVTCSAVMNLYYSKIPMVHWETILQKMFSMLFDEIKKCTKKQYNSEITLAFVNYRFNKFLQGIFEEFINNDDELTQEVKQELICEKESVIVEYIPTILEILINNEEYDEIIKLLNNDKDYIRNIEELLEAGKINIENYNKLIENPKYKTIKETYDIQMQKELKELNETIDKCYKNPFLLVKELVLNIALDIVIYPLKRFINKFKKGK